MTFTEPYRLSFLVGGLLSVEAAIAAPLYLDRHDWSEVRSALVEGNLLHARTRATAVRVARELVQRMTTLSDDELVFLATALAPDRGHLMWAAACRRYTLVADFAQEVLRDRYLVGAATVTPVEFERFWEEKALWHGELEEVRPSTRSKIRTNLFLAMRQAGFLAEDGEIVSPLLSPGVRAFLEERIPSDLRFFPVRGAL